MTGLSQCRGSAVSAREAYRASLKTASVTQPGRRRDSLTKLTAPVFLHTFTENDGVFRVEGESGGRGSDHSGFFITCRR